MNAPSSQPLSEQFLTLQEIVDAARRNLAPGPWSYLVGGAETETTVRRNRLALDSLAFRPRVLRDVSRIDSTWTFLGEKVRLPVMLAPIGGLESIAEGGAAGAARGGGGVWGAQRASPGCPPGPGGPAAPGGKPALFQPRRGPR